MARDLEAEADQNGINESHHVREVLARHLGRADAQGEIAELREEVAAVRRELETLRRDLLQRFPRQR